MTTKYFLLITEFFFSVMCFAQLQDTKWTGNVFMETETEVNLLFGKDIVEMQLGDLPIARMKYELKDSTIILTKLQGGSPCNPETDRGGTYKISFEKNTFKLIPVEDECDARLNGFKNSAFTRKSVSLQEGMVMKWTKMSL